MKKQTTHIPQSQQDTSVEPVPSAPPAENPVPEVPPKKNGKTKSHDGGYIWIV